MKVTCDAKYGVAYVYLRKGKRNLDGHNYSSILPLKNCDLVLDFDFHENLLGVEVIRKGKK